jgi:hypothetical protein
MFCASKKPYVRALTLPQSCNGSKEAFIYNLCVDTPVFTAQNARVAVCQLVSLPTRSIICESASCEATAEYLFHAADGRIIAYCRTHAAEVAREMGFGLPEARSTASESEKSLENFVQFGEAAVQGCGDAVGGSFELTRHTAPSARCAHSPYDRFINGDRRGRDLIGQYVGEPHPGGRCRCVK